MNNKEKQYEFVGKVNKNVYDSPDFKVYAIDVDRTKYPYIKFNKYNNVSITGNIPELSINIDYNIIAVETGSKYGPSYNVISINVDAPRTEEEVKSFLYTILPPSWAKVWYENYPDIIDRVKEGKLDDIDLNKLPGIGKINFNKTIDRISNNFCLADLSARFNNCLSISMLKKIYEEYLSIDVAEQKIKEEPYTSLTKIGGIGFKKADDAIIKMQDSGSVDFGYDIRLSTDRCVACIRYILEECQKSGGTKENLADVRRSCLELVPECANKFDEAIQSNLIYYNKDTMEIALSETYESELYIAERIMYAVNKECDIWKFDIEKYRNIGDFCLSDQQIKMLDNVCKNNISILNGFAGSGKSASTKALINMLENNGKSYKLLAPTGKASLVISDFTGRESSTISMTVQKLYRRKDNRIIDADIIIVDEFSMCDILLFKRLLKYIDLNNTRLLLIGDSAQLPSVGCGNLLHDFVNSKVIETATLTKIFRYQDGGLMKCATDIRNCKQYLNNSMKNKATTFGNEKDYMFVDMDSENIPRQTVALYKKLLDNGIEVKNIQVLSAKNIGKCGTEELNNMLQKVANKNYGIGKSFTISNTTFFKGDIVLERVNYYRDLYDVTGEFIIGKELVVANGDVGVITDINKEFVTIEFDNETVEFDQYEMNNVSLGYAISIHKSQGSGVDNVIVCTPSSHTFMLSSNMLYVALTRAKKKCYHLGEIKTVNSAIHKKENFNRNTFMKDLLIRIDNKKSQQ